MTENLRNTTSQLIEKYTDILEENGDPNEAYKYLAINTFQQNWDLEAMDFHQMFKSSFNKVANLLYQNSWGFIEKSAQLFPNDVREMFRNLYDESVDISQRITTFQTESENILPKVRQALNRNNVNAQQDERTISVYLAFRFPEKYMLYKADYYKSFCEQLNIKAKKSGERFLHLEELSEQIIKENLLDNEFINTYRKFYQKPEWDDKYLMIQNILYVSFRKVFNVMKNFKDFIEHLKAYIDDNHINYKLGAKGRNWIWTFDQDEYFNNEYVHYEFLLIKNKISIDLHFEKSVKTAREFHNLIGELPDFLEWKRWLKNVDSISHKNKIDFNSEDCIEKSIEVLNELYEHTYPLLIEKVKLLKGIPENYNPMENIKADKKTPLNQILFGAPGTGKTYNTKRIAVEIINGEKERTREEINAEYENLVDAKQIVFTTFHQSLSYVDFIEGIKPIMDENEDGANNITYEVREGIFKELCNNANTSTLKKTSDNFEEVWDRLIEEVKNKIADNELMKIGSWEYGLSSKDSLKYSSVNSPSQYTFTITKQNILDTYQNKQARPSGAFQKDMRDIVEYMKTHFNLKKHKDGKETLKSIVPYVFIIDEINRGNVSAIFGELITLLEEDKRKGNKEQTEVTLPYSADKFSVPNNVYIIGTMNTADRSVEALDTALRRRFSFVEMQPNPSVLKDSEYKNVNLKQLLETINQRIEVLIDKDHQIGHSYFIGIENLYDLKMVFKDKIIPLLEEYFFGDFGKIGLVLGGNFIFQEENTAKFPKNFMYDNDFLEDKKVYRFTTSDNWNESTFISVYED